MPPIVDQFFDWLKDFSSSPWFYAIIFVIAVLDAIFPVVPSETLVILGGVSAGTGALEIPVVIACAAAGAFIGDNTSFLIGGRASAFVMRRYTRTEKGKRRMSAVIEQIHERGGLLLVTARFVPGGRTLLTLSCGITRQPHRWFAGWATIAALIWANYAALLGYLGGRTFADNHTLAFGVAFGTALSITLVIEAVRFLVTRRNGRR